MAARSHLALSQARGNLPIFLVALLFTLAVTAVNGAPSAEEKIKRVTEIFNYAKAGDIPKFQTCFSEEATYQYAGGPELPWTGPFKGQDSCVKALEIYSTLFDFELRSFDCAVSPSTGKVMTRVDSHLKALETSVEFDEDCFLYVTLNDDLLVTEIVENCNSLVEFLALQSKACTKRIEECAKQHDKTGVEKERRGA